jgi:heme-degrading monooxygenase HmoA
MRIAMVMNWDGITPEQYEEVRKTANWEGNVPKGAVFHMAGFHNNELRVTDIWESAEDFNSFVQHRLMPATAAAGATGEPQVEIFPVHAIFAPVPNRLN